ncbi:MAG: hypothetical protein M9963_05025 [Kiritimatiellae bacterium]|nr:hypothetical protein [Kiritimatiellia bacterium]
MIRQSAKVFVLLPALLGIGVALSLDAALDRWMRHARWILLLVAAGFFTEYFFQSKLLLSRLDKTNDAYAAAAHDAEMRPRNPVRLSCPSGPATRTTPPSINTTLRSTASG